eukprot:TRINITY_DN16599_c1_g2_i1.p1 TRINITY_DN16599_c1_g2~~TRINITY_DN16599_c1_g2_i1.p1  ORF type:complete len:489 (+),score=109.07 TRINITY_DN16599_c1_g2_i1:138-1469(+)
MAEGIGNEAPCAMCGKPTVLCCSGCESVYYCSAECQQVGWRSHRRECARNAAALPAGGASGACASAGGAGPDRALTASNATAALPSPRRDRSGPSSPTGTGGRVPNYMRTELYPQSQVEVHSQQTIHEAVTHIRQRGNLLRASAVLAAREERHRDALAFAAEAHEVGKMLKRTPEGLTDSPDQEVVGLVESLLICRSAIFEGRTSEGLHVLGDLMQLTDHLAGTGSTVAIFEPCTAATLLMSVAELCLAYDQRTNAEDYARAALAMARVAHGEGSPAVGDHHAFVAGIYAKNGRFEEALIHLTTLLTIRERHALRDDVSAKLVADAHWNLGVMKFQLGQHTSALESLATARDLYSKTSGDGKATADVDVAAADVYSALGNYKAAVRNLRFAMRARQRIYGFAHPDTRSAAARLDAAVLAMKAELDHNEEALGGHPGATALSGF